MRHQHRCQPNNHYFLCPGSTCNATVVSRRYRRFTTVVETLTTVALLVEPDFYDGCVAQL